MIVVTSGLIEGRDIEKASGRAIEAMTKNAEKMGAEFILLIVISKQLKRCRHKDVCKTIF